MTESTSFTTELKGSHNDGKAPLFSIGNQTLSYDKSWNIVHLHKEWIFNKITSVRDDAWNKFGYVQPSPSSLQIHDVVIGYLGDNSPDLLLSMLACIDLAHCTGNKKCERPLPAMINVRWTPLEIQRALRINTDETTSRKQKVDEKKIHITILLFGEGYMESARQAVHFMNGETMNHFAVGVPLPSFANDTKLYMNNHNNFSRRKTISDSDALILFTSGTSSPNGAKGVRLSHRSLFIQAHAKTCPPCNYDSKSRVVATTVPWFHVGGVSSALAVVLGGGCLVFPSCDSDEEQSGEVQRKGFQPNLVLQSIQPHASSSTCHGPITANTLVVVPAMLHSIFQLQKQKQLPPNDAVRLVLCGGQSIGNELHRQTRRYFPKARIVQTYACTEAGSSITFLDLGYSTTDSLDDATKEDSEQEPKVDGAVLVGSPPQHIEIGIFDENSDINNPVILRQGQMGIIGTRGSHTMSGYWSRGTADESGRKTVQAGDWMLTNDLGYIDNQNCNHLYFCGRANDVIRTGGESVLATEVEQVVSTHSEVEECAIFALPDAKFGELVCAAIVIKEVKSPKIEVDGVIENDHWRMLLRAHCEQQQLAGFKRPRRVFLLHSLPRNSSGKVLKYEIKKVCAACLSVTSRL